jgi:CRISPR-associated protein Csb3
LKLDPLNPGHFVACCGVLELADRAWGGAEGWFEERDAFFCAAPCELDTSRDFGGAALLESIRSAMLTNVLMNGDQRKRLDELSTTLKKSKMNAGAADHGGTEPSFAALKAEKDALEALWDEA